MKYISIAIVLFASGMFWGCGDPKVDLTEVTYEPKIVIEAYLFAGEPVKDIRIMRNFPLNQSVDSLSLFVRNANVTINGTVLEFDSVSSTYFSKTLTVQKGSSYTLRVEATIAGMNLTSNSTTVVPADGFTLLSKNLGTIPYDTEIPIVFIPSSSNNFYAFSVKPADATLANFIYGNHYVPNIKTEDLIKDFNRYKFQMNWLQDVTTDKTERIAQVIKGFDTWFYGPYTTIVYVGDTNFKDYVLTGKNVQEFDGNFHEPKTHFTGDGIGVFASAIRDTVIFTIAK